MEKLGSPLSVMIKKRLKEGLKINSKMKRKDTTIMKYTKIVIMLFIFGFIFTSPQVPHAADGSVVPTTAIEQQAPTPPKPDTTPQSSPAPAIDMQKLQQKIIELNTEIEMLRYGIKGIQADIRKSIHTIQPFGDWYDKMDAYEQQLTNRLNERQQLVDQIQAPPK